MRSLTGSLLLLSLASCTAGELQDGFQLRCNSESTDSFGNSTSNDADCPQGTSCVKGCCVKTGQTPTCHGQLGYRDFNAQEIGQACTGCPDRTSGCAGTCSESVCLSEAAYGLPGGSCTFIATPGETNCIFPSGSLSLGLPGTNSICLQSCDGRNCRRGWRCDCPANNGNWDVVCGCVPDCGSAPDVCGPGTTVNGSRCNAATGLCRTAQECTPDGACVLDTDCCAGATCCQGLCAAGGCP